MARHSVWVGREELYDLIVDDEQEKETQVYRPRRTNVVRHDVRRLAPVAIAPPRRRHRNSLLLRTTLIASAVAIMFVLGWWQGSRHGLPIPAEPAAATRVAERTDAPRASRTLAPPEEEPSSRPHASKPAAPRPVLAPSEWVPADL